MSWKLTKKLKETHLAPLANTFSRSSTASSPKPEASAEDGAPLSKTPTASSSTSSIAASEATANPPTESLKPGILIVTLHEGKGFSLSPHYEQVFNSHYQSSGGSYSASMRPSSSSHASHIPNSFTHSMRPQSTSGGINAAPTNHGRYSTKHLPYALLDFDKLQVFVDSVSGSPENPLWAGDNTSFKFDVSRATDLNVQVYIRNPAARPGSGRSDDIFLGACKINPRFEERRRFVEDPKASKKEREKAAAAFAQREKQLGQLGSEWIDLQFGTGSIKIGVSFVENRQRSLTMADFELLKVVGERQFRQSYASHAHIISRSEVEHTLAERSVLSQISNPFIVPLKFSFQSPEKLYLVLAFVNGGELFHHLQREQRFDINRARFYTAELLCALECLHGFKVIYRDLKPENILLDYSGHIALCDFGLCKLGMKDEDRTNTFCGTPEYLAPELLLGHGYTKAVDWWTLGVLLYEMLTGLPPFYDEDTNEMYRKILHDPLTFPGPEIVPGAARDLLSRLLDRDPHRRLGANGAGEIKGHHFFANIDWRKLLQRKYEPSFRPNVADARDTANFDAEFTSEVPFDSYEEGSGLSRTMQKPFEGWSYNRPIAGLNDGGGSVRDPAFGSIPE
ncbi:AGC/AKT protein kinase [Nannizzia gypsea CBS 118893]|uniref:non-specific serine/threonine protein kinase n=1 Tax=Arthroderma gypseum (strain ATCC MYA-4604 / CBS 118893) TaxID=535722 RepID=E4UPW3_ARTGP|nr:AGC/AKT protein kinase [Nannizzia gypsea CBS 118893]EFQ99935.1 AGC/AKT protein kinase [Nannizzia gypsea CBS 118893]